MKLLNHLLVAAILSVATGCITSGEGVYKVTIRNSMNSAKYAPAIVTEVDGGYIATVPAGTTTTIKVEGAILITAKMYNSSSGYCKSHNIHSDTTIRLN